MVNKKKSSVRYISCTMQSTKTNHTPSVWRDRLTKSSVLMESWMIWPRWINSSTRSSMKKPNKYVSCMAKIPGKYWRANRNNNNSEHCTALLTTDYETLHTNNIYFVCPRAVVPIRLTIFAQFLPVSWLGLRLKWRSWSTKWKMVKRTKAIYQCSLPPSAKAWKWWESRWQSVKRCSRNSLIRMMNWRGKMLSSMNKYIPRTRSLLLVTENNHIALFLARKGESRADGNPEARINSESWHPLDGQVAERYADQFEATEWKSRPFIGKCAVSSADIAITYAQFERHFHWRRHVMRLSPIRLFNRNSITWKRAMNTWDMSWPQESALWTSLRRIWPSYKIRMTCYTPISSECNLPVYCLIQRFS